MGKYWPILAFMLLLSCEQVPVAEVRLVAENTLTASEITQTLKVIKARLSAADIKWEAVHYLEDEAQFSVLLLADYERDQLEGILLEKVEIGFWPTYRSTDKLISDFVQTITEEQWNLPRLL